MAKGIRNLVEFISSVKDSKVKLSTKIRFIMTSEIKQAELEAKMNAPVDTGKHRQAIHGIVNANGMGGKLVANELYAPYLEFGTGGLVSVPKGFEELAIRFKGNGQAKINLKPRPHLIPAALNAVVRIEKRIEKELEKL